MGGGLSDDLSGYEGDDRIYGGPGQTHGYGEAREYARDLGLKSTASYLQNDKRPELTFRALLTDGDTRQRLEFVAIRGKPPLEPKGTPSVLP